MPEVHLNRYDGPTSQSADRPGRPRTDLCLSGFALTNIDCKFHQDGSDGSLPSGSTPIPPFTGPWKPVRTQGEELCGRDVPSSRISNVFHVKHREADRRGPGHSERGVRFPTDRQVLPRRGGGAESPRPTVGEPGFETLPR
jgi:hypothetical protein